MPRYAWHANPLPNVAMAIDYEYFCEANGRSVSVRHGISQEIKTWSELCSLSGEELGGTDPAASVSRKIFGGILSLERRVSKEAPQSDYDPVLHGNESCISSGCGSKNKKGCSH